MGRSARQLVRAVSSGGPAVPPYGPVVALETDLHVPDELGFLDKMPIGLAIYDADGLLVHSTPHLTRLIGDASLPSGARGGARWQGLGQDGGDLAPAAFPCARAFRGETVSPGIDLLYRDAGGSRRTLNVSAAPIRDPECGGIVVGIVLLVLDTNDSAQAAAFASRAGRRFRQFAEHSSMAIWIADVATRDFTYRNPRHIDLIDTVARTIVSLSDWIDQIDAGDRAAVRRAYERVLDGSTEHRTYRLLGGDGQLLHHVRETSFPIRDDAGAIVMIGGMTEHVTPACDQAIYCVGTAAAALPGLGTRLGRSRLALKPFASLREFLDVARFLAAGCVVIDLVSTADAAEQLDRALADHGADLPIVIVGEPRTPAFRAVAAMRAGAADYLIAPVRENDLADALLRASARLRRPVEPEPAAAAGADRLARIARLSPREREVLAGLTGGGTNKSIGRDLGISPRTVELHRSHLMERMNVRSLAELVQAAQSLAT